MYTIKFADEKQLEKVKQLAKQESIEHRKSQGHSPRWLRKYGFLFSPLHDYDYNWAQRDEHLLVCLDERKQVCGYAIFSWVSGVEYGREGKFLKKHRDQGIIIREVCVRPARRRKGVAKLLYERIAEEYPNWALYVSLLDSKKLHSDPAHKFHQALGFQSLPGYYFGRERKKHTMFMLESKDTRDFRASRPEYE